MAGWLNLLTDTMTCWSLKARYQRLLQEQMLGYLERGSGGLEVESERGWKAVGGDWQSESARKVDERREARRAVLAQPHARQILRLLEAYVVGEGFQLTFQSGQQQDQRADDDTVEALKRLWEEFLQINETHFSFREFARRVWRDGECFLRIFPQSSWPPEVRFIDPEQIAATREEPESEGILTADDDVESPEYYLLIDPRNGELQEEIPAELVIHCKYGVDANQKRGKSFFAAILDPLEKYQQWQETELQARNLQSSIVLWRKVQGGMAQAQGVVDQGRGEGSRGERIQPGTILTTSAGTDIKFLQPDTNFGDAVPLGRMILLSIAAGAGIPEFMLTADAANGNYSSTMVAEGPAVKLFQCEQSFMSRSLGNLWRRIMEDAIDLDLLEEGELDHVDLKWSYPQLVSRDRPREREADVRLLEAGVLSRAEVQRRENLVPDQIQAEIDDEEADRGHREA